MHAPPSRRHGHPSFLVIAGLLAALITLCSCAHGASGQARLSELVGNAEAHDGELVRTSGTVRTFRDTPQSAPYYVLEDGAHNRVLLDPPGATTREIGHHVVVEGCFTYSDTSGQRIAVTSVVAPAQHRASSTNLSRSCVRSGERPTISAPH